MSHGESVILITHLIHGGYPHPKPSPIKGEGERKGFNLAIASPNKLLPLSRPLEGGRRRVGVNKLPPNKLSSTIPPECGGI